MKVIQILEWGRIVKGVNTTPDVGVGEIPRQAKKFGNSVSKDGRPPTLSTKVKGKSTNVLFNLGLTEGIQLKFQRGEDFDTLHIKPKNKNRVELRGKPGYERGNYDAQDKLHQVLDQLGKAANFAELMNGETVSINPKHPDGERATKTAQDILSTEDLEEGDFEDTLMAQKAIPHIITQAEKITSTLGPKYGNMYLQSRARDFSKAGVPIPNMNRSFFKIVGEAKEIANTTKIYVDMDGVLADFFNHWGELMGVDDWRNIDKEHDINDALQKIRDTDDFWLNIPMTPNAKNLLNLIKEVKGSYTILSSPLPGDPNSEPHKREWIEKHLGFFPPEEVLIRHDKETFATQEDGTPNILIDDYGVNIQKWEAAGGVGFKHKDHKFERTAKNIQQHMQDPVTEEMIVENPAIIAALYAAGMTVRELVKRYGVKAVRQAIDKLKSQKPKDLKPANDQGGVVDDILSALKRPRSADEIARSQQQMLPRALENAKGMIRSMSKDFKAGRMTREEYQQRLQWVRERFKKQTGQDLPIDDLLKITENFADGKKKGKSRPGRVKRSGASCNGSVTSLRKRAKNSSGEKARMYHWCANMKSGRKKS